MAVEVMCVGVMTGISLERQTGFELVTSAFVGAVASEALEEDDIVADDSRLATWAGRISFERADMNAAPIPLCLCKVSKGFLGSQYTPVKRCG